MILYLYGYTIDFLMLMHAPLLLAVIVATISHHCHLLVASFHKTFFAAAAN